MEYILIIISAVIVNNVVLAQFLGICPFLGVSNKVKTALGMAGAVTFVIVLATMVTYLDPGLCSGQTRYRLHADNYLYPCYCCACSDGRDNT